MSTKVSEIWSDLDPRLIADGQGNIKQSINIAAVMTSIENILRTSRGERVMLPQFGAGLKGCLFENTNSTMLKFIARDIKESIEAWDNRPKIQEVELNVEPDQSSISVRISFSISGQSSIYQYVTSIKGD